MGYLNPKNKAFKAWDDIGDLQFEFMKDAGLLPEHKLLDIGCGSLRGGKRFIPYLDKGNYYGVDKDAGRIADGREWLMEYYKISTVGSHICVMEDFNFTIPFFSYENYDFIIAQSLFPHLSNTHILKCLEGVADCLSKEGRFFATFFEAKADEKKIVWDENTVTYSGIDPGHQPFKEIQELAKKVGLEVHNLEDWGHPRHQRMLAFTHTLTGVDKTEGSMLDDVVGPPINLKKFVEEGSHVLDKHNSMTIGPTGINPLDVKEVDLPFHKILDSGPDVLDGTVSGNVELGNTVNHDPHSPHEIPESHQKVLGIDSDGKEVKPDGKKAKKKKSTKAVRSHDSSGRGRKHRKVSEVDN